MKTIIVTPPVNEPITLAEAKEQLRIETAFTVDDDYINALIKAARDRCEKYCNQFFTVQDIQLVNTGVAEDTISIPYPGLSISSITYVDENYATQTIDPADYFFDQSTQRLTFLRQFNSKSYTISAATSAPAEFEGVIQAMKMIITDMYELRTETVIGSSLADNPAVKALLYPYRVELGV